MIEVGFDFIVIASNSDVENNTENAVKMANRLVYDFMLPPLRHSTIHGIGTAAELQNLASYSRIGTPAGTSRVFPTICNNLSLLTPLALGMAFAELGFECLLGTTNYRKDLSMNIKNILTAVLLALGSLSLPACTDEEVGLTVGAIIGGVIGVALADDDSSNDHGHHRRNDDYGNHQGRHGRHDDYGDYRGRPGDDYRRGDRGGCYRGAYGCYNARLDIDLQNQLVVDTAAERVASRYQISTAAAQTIVTALEKAKEKDFSALRELGFDRENFEAIYQNENPSVETLRTMSERLGMNLGDTHTMIQKMKSDIKAARAQQVLN